MSKEIQNIGIDLGTCNSCVAEYKDNMTQALVNKVSGKLTTPSYVTYPSMLIGQLEKDKPTPGYTISSFKRLIGRRFTDAEVKEQMKRVDYKIIQKDEHSAIQLPNNTILTPSQVSGDFLRELKAQTGFQSKQVVITVPAYFTHYQKLQTEQAGTLADLSVMRLLAEPTAAALQYNQQLSKSQLGQSENIIVVDLGAGTFDVSVLERQGDVYQVIAASGNNYYGGDDYTNAIKRFLNDKHNLNVPFEEAEKIKHQFSNGNYNVHNIEISPKDIAELFEPLDIKLQKPILQALSDSGLQKSQINKVILVGGQTKQPSIKNKIQDILQLKPVQSINPDLSVAQGASIQAAILNNQINSVLLLDATPFSLGIETFGGVYSQIIGRNVTLPVKQSQIFTTTEDNQEFVSIKIYQGENQLASQNVFLDEFILQIQPGQPRGAPRIRVEFEIDQNGIVRVSAIDEKTGKKQQVNVKYKNDDAKPQKTEEEALHDYLLAQGVKLTGKESLTKLQAMKKKIERRQSKK